MKILKISSVIIMSCMAANSFSMEGKVNMVSSADLKTDSARVRDVISENHAEVSDVEETANESSSESVSEENHESESSALELSDDENITEKLNAGKYSKVPTELSEIEKMIIAPVIEKETKINSVAEKKDETVVKSSTAESHKIGKTIGYTTAYLTAGTVLTAGGLYFGAKYMTPESDFVEIIDNALEKTSIFVVDTYKTLKEYGANFSNEAAFTFSFMLAEFRELLEKWFQKQ